jgi:hypothetical protein
MIFNCAKLMSGTFVFFQLQSLHLVAQGTSFRNQIGLGWFWRMFFLSPEELDVMVSLPMGATVSFWSNL